MIGRYKRKFGCAIMTRYHFTSFFENSETSRKILLKGLLLWFWVSDLVSKRGIFFFSSACNPKIWIVGFEKHKINLLGTHFCDVIG
eukprot:UN18057